MLMRHLSIIENPTDQTKKKFYLILVIKKICAYIHTDESDYAKKIRMPGVLGTLL